MNIKEIISRKIGSNYRRAQMLSRECLKCKRWNANPVLMIADAALTSSGLNYFTVVVPKIKILNKFLENNKINSLEKFSKLKTDDKRLLKIFNNPRNWNVAIETSRVLNKIRQERKLKTDIESLKFWANSSNYKNWKKDEIGKIRGVGLNTFQYLRMQGGVDTAMPDKIVKRVVNEILKEANVDWETKTELQLIKAVEKLSNMTGYKQTELCWISWFLTDEKFMDMKKKQMFFQ